MFELIAGLSLLGILLKSFQIARIEEDSNHILEEILAEFKKSTISN